ncbi:MAG: hypothetical protein H0W76_07280 [Pyrinomonadaceae bacterium]|nr:hypothetical protein [Pyrinomonadaceae bacterium]
MDKKLFSKHRTATVASLLLALLFSLSTAARPQQNQPEGGVGGKAPATTSATTSTATPANTAKAEQILKRAIEAQGGQAYLGVRAVVSRGLYTSFQDGQSTLPRTFVDYLVFPDRERTEFRGQGIKVIQTNTGDKGWVYDGATKTLADMKPEQAKDFQTAMRTSPDNVLRGWWRKEEAALSYVGRREAGVGRRNEVVRLTYPDGFTVEFEFSGSDGLPAKTIYKRQNEAGEDVNQEDRFAQYLNIGGVTLPFVIDNFRAGVQTGRINFQKIEMNAPVPETLFARPADVKSLK